MGNQNIDEVVSELFLLIGIKDPTSPISVPELASLYSKYQVDFSDSRFILPKDLSEERIYDLSYLIAGYEKSIGSTYARMPREDKKDFRRSEEGARYSVALILLEMYHLSLLTHHSEESAKLRQNYASFLYPIIIKEFDNALGNASMHLDKNTLYYLARAKDHAMRFFQSNNLYEMGVANLTAFENSMVEKMRLVHISKAVDSFEDAIILDFQPSMQGYRIMAKAYKRAAEHKSISYYEKSVRCYLKAGSEQNCFNAIRILSDWARVCPQRQLNLFASVCKDAVDQISKMDDGLLRDEGMKRDIEQLLGSIGTKDERLKAALSEVFSRLPVYSSANFINSPPSHAEYGASESIRCEDRGTKDTEVLGR